MPYPQVTFQASTIVGLTVKHHANNAGQMLLGLREPLVRSRTPPATFPTGFPAESPQPPDISDMMVLKEYTSYINVILTKVSCKMHAEHKQQHNI